MDLKQPRPNTEAPYPGPYTVGGVAFIDGENEYRAILGPDGRPVAFVPHLPGTYEQERDATAALLAAAHELRITLGSARMIMAMHVGAEFAGSSIQKAMDAAMANARVPR